MASNSKKDFPQDTVILHQIGRGPYAPSLTPFAVKLETYLRMAKIPYQNVHSIKTSSKGKVPWMSYNGKNIADSTFCIHYLNKHRDLDLNSWMNPEQRATALAFQRLVEDDLYWAMVTTRWVNEPIPDWLRQAFHIPLSGLFVKFSLVPSMRKMTWAQGMGRHSPEEIQQIVRKDLTALSEFIGNKNFLMGDEPCEEDCAVFGQLSQFYWHLRGPIADMFKDEYPRLVDYCDRMKDKFWPDWTECTTQGGTVKTTS